MMLWMVVVRIQVNVQQTGVRGRGQQAEGDDQRRYTAHGPSVSEVRPAGRAAPRGNMSKIVKGL